MPHPYSNYVQNAKWDDSKKIESRKQAIVDQYHQFFGKQVPEGKQYWTMCGAYFDEQNNRLHGELGQLVNEGLITPDQFHGVDCEAIIIATNQQLYPDVDWHLGDFKDVMSQYAIKGKFNPAIINYDGVMQPEFGAKYLKSIMKLIDNNVKDGLLLVANFILRNPYRGSVKFDGSDVIDELKGIYLFPDHWQLLPRFYAYNGTGDRSRTHMGTFVFIKSKHEAIAYSKGKRLTETRYN